MIEFPVFLVFFSAIQLHFTSHHSMSDLTVSYTIHHMNCFQQITCLAFFPIVTRFVFCFQLVYDWHVTWSTWKVTHEWHVLSHDFHMINILCTAVSWSTCPLLHKIKYGKSPECLSHVIWCFQQLSHGWQPVLNDQHGVSHLSILLFESEPLW